ncbi:hypothetical protein [Kitasatospora cinereorecta]|uniref:hypothetical protein n=1 Tax=Kitasatospora cinereorecta TaxID=285560 RepID=UPI0031F8A041
MRVSGGRLDHRVRRVTGRRARLEVACGRHWVYERDLERPLAGVPCPGCEERVRDEADPVGARRRVAAKRAEAAARRGQGGLFPTESVAG